jgi:hypothetical protein
MDQRIEAFLADVLALAGEDLDAVREGVRVALASCEALFRVREPNNRRALEAGARRHRPAGTLSLPERRFPPPWSVDETGHCSPAPVARLPRPLDFGFLQLFHGHWLLTNDRPETRSILSPEEK